MPHPFELTYESEVEATPEQVWEAISTGPGLDAWFMGTNEVEPREGGTARLELPGSPAEESTVTVWQPPTRLVTRSAEAEDGAQHTFDYRVEPRGGGAAITWIHSGFLGDNWEVEYQGLAEGNPMYFAKLAEYLTHFPGRVATPVSAFGPGPADRESAWWTYLGALGLEAMPELDERVLLTPEGLPPIEGVVDYRSPSFLGVRSDDAMYRFMHIDWATAVGLGHHLFAEGLDRNEAEAAWSSWLAGVFPEDPAAP